MSVDLSNVPYHNSLEQIKERRRRELIAKTGGYRRKPKSQRRKPVQEFQIDYMPVEEALLEIGLANTQKAREDRAYGYNRWDGTANYRTADVGIAYRVVCDRLSYHVNPGRSVTMTIGRRIVRATDEGKPYSKWETKSVRTIYLTNKNKIAFLFYDYDINNVTGEKRRSLIRPFDTLSAGIAYSSPSAMNKQWQQVMAAENNIVQTPIAYLRHLAQKEFDRDCSLEGAYPMLRHFGQTELFRPYDLRATTAHEFTEALFGKKTIRKDLIRAVGYRLLSNERPDVRKDMNIYWASLFKDYVPTDWLIPAIKTCTGIRRQELARVEKFNMNFLEMFGMCMNDLKPAERKNLLMDTPSFTDFRDTVRNWYMFQRQDLIRADRDNFKSWKDMHDRLFTAQNERQRIEARKREAERYKPENMWVNKDKGAQQMAFCLEHLAPMPDGIRLEIAKDHGVLFDWSDYMTNCISSYFSSTYTLLGGFYENDVLIANVELRQKSTLVGLRSKVTRAEIVMLKDMPPRTSDLIEAEEIKEYEFTVNQLLGKNNASLDPDLRDTLLKYLEAAGVKRADRIWW